MIGIGIDPGWKKVLTWVEADLTGLLDGRAETVDRIIHSSSYISNADYRDQCGSTVFEEYEKRRRKENKNYATGIDRLQQETKRTCNLEKMESYIKVRLECEDVIRAKLDRALPELCSAVRRTGAH